MTADRLRSLIADDEQPARDRLKRLLAAFDSVAVVGEAEDGEEALERVVALKPDLLFLDIQMPGCSGMEVAASLPSPAPKIIFCTAYDEYAVEAFELHAVDYLLKPVNRARLGQALEHVQQRSAAESARALGAARRDAGDYPSRFLARRGHRYAVVAADEVLFFCSEEGQTRLQTAQAHYWMQPPLAELEARLDPRRFFRISRSSIVNLDCVQEVVPLVGGHGQVRLSGGSGLDVARRRFKPLMELLSTL